MYDLHSEVRPGPLIMRIYTSSKRHVKKPGPVLWSLDSNDLGHTRMYG